MEAVDLSNLWKRYGKITALTDITMTIPEGTIYGLLGPNGAGKTTLIKAMVGAVKPSRGTVRVLGENPITRKRYLRRHIGYMPQFPALYEDLSARENIGFFGQVQGVHPLADKIDHILSFTELIDRADDPVHTFSGGMKKRVSLACALIHEPRLLFLDEPTAAVDPYLRQRSWDLFHRLAAGGTTLLISTHLMDEALNCDRLAILRKGRLLTADTPEHILERGETAVTLCRQGREERLITSGKPEDVAAALAAYGLWQSISSVRVEPASLESVFLSLVDKEP